jgi:hypothetical protein
MLLGTRKTLYDHITELLLEKEANVPDISANLEKIKIKATIQGIYKALRELIAEDIVLKQKKIYSINNVWREKVGKLFSSKYQFKLSPGEQVIYRFNKITHLDAFWKSTLSDIQKETGDYPTFDAVPHQFWFYADGRRESEIEYQASFDTKKIYLFSIIGGTTAMDKQMKSVMQSEYHQVHLTDKSRFAIRDNITVMDSYIIVTKISSTLATAIDTAYKSISNEQELEKRLNELYKKPGIIKLTIEHNQKKAKLLRKKMSHNFYIPKAIQKKFKLY